jgi:hypothetical protein
MKLKEHFDKLIEDDRGILLAFLSLFIIFSFSFLSSFFISFISLYYNVESFWNIITVVFLIGIPIFIIAYAVKKKEWMFIIRYICGCLLLFIAITILQCSIN